MVAIELPFLLLCPQSGLAQLSLSVDPQAAGIPPRTSSIESHDYPSNATHCFATGRNLSQAVELTENANALSRFWLVDWSLDLLAA